MSEAPVSDDAVLGLSDALPLSVIVSARDSARTLRESLAAVRRSALPTGSYELIVVDDSSTDPSVAIAARFADTVIRLTRPSGPAYARNRAVEIARGKVLGFVDADVVVEP